MDKILKILFSRAFVIGMLILIQASIFILILFKMSEISTRIYNTFYFISFVFILYLFSSEQSSEYKLVWALVMMLFPPLGGVFYLLWGKRSTDWRALSALKIIYTSTAPLLNHGSDDYRALKESDRSLSRIPAYLYDTSKAGLYKNCSAEYYPCGEDFFPALKAALQSAERFICMEYFIIEPGKMWNEILTILIEKIKSGVEVYFMYDDAGTVSKVPHNYDAHLRNMGIKAVKFNKLRPRMYTLMNYRDHRKITVIDGKIAFTGGINLADEYINETHPFGYWKDTAIKTEGKVVWEFTVMFFQLWCFASKQYVDINNYRTSMTSNGSGYVQVFGDDPLDEINVSEDTYINLISRAKKYIYIMTPYLIIDSRVIGALQSAARSGVDVKIMTPGIPDKKLVFYVTQSYYGSLLKAGVQIYEYTPGFLHAKSIVTDDDAAIVGTVNMDYRSLYLHFECAAIFYKGNIPVDVRRDYELSLASCRQITMPDVKSTFIVKKIIQAVLRIFAPLM